MKTEHKRKKNISGMSIRTKLLCTFALTSALMIMINLVMYNEINRSMRRLDEVYATNVSLNELAECLKKTQEEVEEYLNTKSTESLENYYRYVQEYQDMLEQLNGAIIGNDMKIQEKNIRNMSELYLELSDETILAKRGRNVEKYKAAYDREFLHYQYIRTAIDRLNNLQFQNNSHNYQIMQQSLRYMELVNMVIVIAAAVITLFLLVFLIRTITEPLRMLARSANEVADGNFEVQLPDIKNSDEVGVVTQAFVKMVYSVREHIDKLRESMEKEQKMMERELLMETHLKDAQLKYLQAQINPHFLFNSLNAGAQLAMMEDAEQTSIFVEKMADFFRYNVHKIEEATTLAQEIEAVENYVYILNVRFAGDIHFDMELAEDVEDVQMPGMILQPIVENAVNHGIRNVEWDGYIHMTVKKQTDALKISIQDNGQGMTQERIREVLEGRAKSGETEKDVSGIGIDNVINRLNLFFGQKGLLQIYSDGPGTGTEVQVTIPYASDINIK